MAIGDIFQFSAVNIQAAEPCATIFYQETVEDAGSLDPEKDAADALANVILTEFNKMQSNQVVYECILSRRILPTTTPARVVSITNQGDLVGQALPANVAVSFRHYSENGDKRKRGRYLINGLLETWVADGRINS
ncbi:MAG: hypothetical protein ACR2RE_01380, partial [Geminicoccaceae bacterium]